MGSSGASSRHHAVTPTIDEALVAALIHDQFPQWACLQIQPIVPGGWDNRSFRLGESMVVRLPSAEEYASQVQTEQQWLPVLAAAVSTRIPTPLGRGLPGRGYPWSWTIYPWIEGIPVDPAEAGESVSLASDVAGFLLELQATDALGGPSPGARNFHRGGALAAYDSETRVAIAQLHSQIDARAATDVWEVALRTSWRQPSVWVHGDISAGNLLVTHGHLSGVIDFGSLAVGDPACDLSVAWTVFRGRARRTFRSELSFDAPTWNRARAWALWKGLILAAGLAETNAVEWAHPHATVHDILEERFDA